MARVRRLPETPTHHALAARVLSAAGDLKTGLASEGPLPSRQDVRILVEELLEVLFPESHRLGTDGGSLQDHVAATIGSLETHLETAVFLGLHRLCGGKQRPLDKCARRARVITGKLLEALPDIRAELAKDVLAAYERDPAASGIDEIVACYPAFTRSPSPRGARAARPGGRWSPAHDDVSTPTRHGHRHPPGSHVGAGFFIDHGTGVVIGETCQIGAG